MTSHKVITYLQVPTASQRPRQRSRLPGSCRGKKLGAIQNAGHAGEHTCNPSIWKTGQEAQEFASSRRHKMQSQDQPSRPGRAQAGTSHLPDSKAPNPQGPCPTHETLCQVLPSRVSTQEERWRGRSVTSPTLSPQEDNWGLPARGNRGGPEPIAAQGGAKDLGQGGPGNY